MPAALLSAAVADAVIKRERAATGDCARCRRRARPSENEPLGSFFLAGGCW